MTVTGRTLRESFSDKPHVTIPSGFEDGSAAIAAIRAGHVKPEHVLIVRGMGPNGGPGMAGAASMVVFSRSGAGLEQDVACVTDGQLSSLCNKGLTDAEVSPEAAVGGPLGLIEDGDRITIDVDRRSLAPMSAGAGLIPIQK
jgi:dihydroxy-acid dehydratase